MSRGYADMEYKSTIFDRQTDRQTVGNTVFLENKILYGIRKVSFISERIDGTFLLNKISRRGDQL